MYVMLDKPQPAETAELTGMNCPLWFSPLHITDPDVPVYGPILEQVLLAGDKWLAQTTPDTTALLVELLDLDQPVQQSRSDEKQN